MVRHGIDISEDRIAEFCRQNHIKKFSLFGSVLRDDFRPDSDIDVLVVFKPNHRIGFRIITMEDELSTIFGGHKVDIVSEKYLYHRLKDRILASSRVIYEEG